MMFAGPEIAERSASPPELDEVVRELDSDTRHVGSPTRSPRNRRPWSDDPYHFPSYTRKWTTSDERNALVAACQGFDPDREGQIPLSEIGTILGAIGEKCMAAKAGRSLPRQTKGRGMTRQEVVTFRSLVDFLDESMRKNRLPFGRKRCIVNRLHLPQCCSNGNCVAHLEKPTWSRPSGDDDGDLAKAALKIVFARHDVDKSGSLRLEELPRVLEEHGVEYDGRQLTDILDKYDVDGSGGLDFDEFTGLLKDMHADEAVARRRMHTCELPASLLKEFSKDAIEEMRTTFGMFDESGDGTLDEDELEKLLRKFGQEPTKEKMHQEMLRIDYDRSGTVEFREFVLLMKKIRDGEVELDDSAFGRAVMNSLTATRLSHELTAMEGASVPGVKSAKLVMSSPATLEAIMAGPSGSPYEGSTMTLEVIASDGYPFTPPAVRLKERVFHLNFTILLDGSTGVRPLLDQWTAAWDVARLCREVVALLTEPDPSLLPDDVRQSEHGKRSKHDQPYHETNCMVTFTTDASVIDEKLVAENNEPLRGEGPGTIAQPDCPPGETHRPVAAHGPEKAATGRITSLDEAGGGARGNDLREKQRSAVVTARVAAMWYHDRPAYERTARRVSQQQQLQQKKL